MACMGREITLLFKLITKIAFLYTSLIAFQD